MNLLQIVQQFAGRTGIPVPTFVASNSDPQVLQAMGLLNEFCDDMTTRKAWQVTTLEATFVSTAAEDQGSIHTIAPYGFQRILLETVFDRTQELPLFGGLSASEWQARKAFNITGPQYEFRLRGDHLLFSPALPAAHTIAFEYNSTFYIQNNAVSGTDPAAYRQYWSKDTDTCLLNDALPLSYLRWAWKKEKGLEYAEDFAKYERIVATYCASDARPQVALLHGRTLELRPGIWVPAGNWMQP